MKHSPMKPGKIKLAIFDFDGTIADTIHVGVRIYNTISHKYGLPAVSEEEMKTLRDISLREIIKRMKISMYKVIILSRKLQLMLSEKMGEVKPFKGMRKVLKELSTEMALGIISSNSRDNILSFLRNNRLEGIFRFIEGYPFLFGKDRKITSIRKKIALNPEEVAYIGDEVRDVQAANKAGVISVACTWGYNSSKRLKESEPDIMVNKAKELLILRSLLSESDGTTKV